MNRLNQAGPDYIPQPKDEGESVDFVLENVSDSERRVVEAEVAQLNSDNEARVVRINSHLGDKGNQVTASQLGNAIANVNKKEPGLVSVIEAEKLLGQEVVMPTASASEYGVTVPEVSSYKSLTKATLYRGKPMYSKEIGNRVEYKTSKNGLTIFMKVGGKPYMVDGDGIPFGNKAVTEAHQREYGGFEKDEFTDEDYLSYLAKSLDTPEKLHYFFHFFFKYTSDIEKTTLTVVDGCEKGETRAKDSFQSASESVNRVDPKTGEMLGDCDDYAFFARDIMRRRGESAFNMYIEGTNKVPGAADNPEEKTSAHSLCVWFEEIDGRWHAYSMGTFGFDHNGNWSRSGEEEKNANGFDSKKLALESLMEKFGKSGLGVENALNYKIPKDGEIRTLHYANEKTERGGHEFGQNGRFWQRESLNDLANPIYLEQSEGSEDTLYNRFSSPDGSLFSDIFDIYKEGEPDSSKLVRYLMSEERFTKKKEEYISLTGDLRTVDGTDIMLLDELHEKVMDGLDEISEDDLYAHLIKIGKIPYEAIVDSTESSGDGDIQVAVSGNQALADEGGIAVLNPIEVKEDGDSSGSSEATSDGTDGGSYDEGSQSGGTGGEAEEEEPSELEDARGNENMQKVNTLETLNQSGASKKMAEILVDPETPYWKDRIQRMTEEIPAFRGNPEFAMNVVEHLQRRLKVKPLDGKPGDGTMTALRQKPLGIQDSLSLVINPKIDPVTAQEEEKEQQLYKILTDNVSMSKRYELMKTTFDLNESEAKNIVEKVQTAMAIHADGYPGPGTRSALMKVPIRLTNILSD